MLLPRPIHTSNESFQDGWKKDKWIKNLWEKKSATDKREGGIQRNDRQDLRKKRFKKEKEKNFNTENERERERE